MFFLYTIYMSIVIIPYGDIGEKLIAIMGAIDLQKRTNKKIEIWYTKQYNDLFYDSNSNFLLDDLPEFKFKNINYKLKEFEYKDSHGLHLQRLLIYKQMDKYAKEYSKDKNLNIHEFRVIENKYPSIDSGIIQRTWIKGLKNNSFEDLKNWLKDITKYKVYDNFMKYVGFDWIDSDSELVYMNIPITTYLESIYYNLNSHYILSPDYYDDALKIIKSKTNKKLQIYIRTDVDKKYLSDYLIVIQKYGQIIESDIFYPQSYELLICSKAYHIIGALSSFTYIATSIFPKKNSVCISPNFEIFNKGNYSDNVIFLDENKYKINTSRSLENYYFKGSLYFKSENLYKSESIKLQLESVKKYLNEAYGKYYSQFDKYIESKFLKDLLLYRVLIKRNKVRIVNSNISIKEGLEIYKLIKKYKPKKLIEIGLACGISTCFMLCAISSGDKVYSVDPFQKIQWDRFGLINAYEVIKELKLPNNSHNWIPKYSSDYFKSTNDKYDFMLIDGDHSYNGTMIDLNGSLKILNNKGILVVDDVLHREVGKAVRDFMRNNKRYIEIKNNVKTMGFYIKN